MPAYADKTPNIINNRICDVTQSLNRTYELKNLNP